MICRAFVGYWNTRTLWRPAHNELPIIQGTSPFGDRVLPGSAIAAVLYRGTAIAPFLPLL
jgi:hypothetical protein